MLLLQIWHFRTSNPLSSPFYKVNASPVNVKANRSSVSWYLASKECRRVQARSSWFEISFPSKREEEVSDLQGVIRRRRLKVLFGDTTPSTCSFQYFLLRAECSGSVRLAFCCDCAFLHSDSSHSVDLPFPRWVLYKAPPQRFLSFQLSLGSV